MPNLKRRKKKHFVYTGGKSIAPVRSPGKSRFGLSKERYQAAGCKEGRAKGKILMEEKMVVARINA